MRTSEFRFALLAVTLPTVFGGVAIGGTPATAFTYQGRLKHGGLRRLVAAAGPITRAAGSTTPKGGAGSAMPRADILVVTACREGRNRS